MPRYVFEISVTLGTGHAWTAEMCYSVEKQLRAWFLHMMQGQPGPYEVNTEPPFEHVTGDWLPPDENGAIKVGPSRPIDA
jgi:hypothetical protein